MTDDELRAMVREAIARHVGGIAGGRGVSPAAALVPSWSPSSAGLGGVPSARLSSAPALTPAATALPSAPSIVTASAPGGIALAVGPGATVQLHISHAAFSLPPACEGGHDGPCTIEPDAACNQCGFCQSYGH